MDISHAHIAGDSTLLLHRQTLYSMTLSHVHVVRHAGSSMALYAGRLMVINFAEQIYGCTVTRSNTTHEAEKKANLPKLFKVDTYLNASCDISPNINWLREKEKKRNINHNNKTLGMKEEKKNKHTHTKRYEP